MENNKKLMYGYNFFFYYYVVYEIKVKYWKWFFKWNKFLFDESFEREKYYIFVEMSLVFW